MQFSLGVNFIELLEKISNITASLHTLSRYFPHLKSLQAICAPACLQASIQSRVTILPPMAATCAHFGVFANAQIKCVHSSLQSGMYLGTHI